MRRTRKSCCSCEVCRSFCRRAPGWVSPAQFRRIAKFLGLTQRDLFRKHFSLIDTGRGWVVVPAVRGRAGREVFIDQAGTCTFFDDWGRCVIHEVKPHECAVAHHDRIYDWFLLPKLKAARSHIVRTWQQPSARRLVTTLRKVNEGPE